MKKAALFLDRDGTLIVEKNYLVSAQEIEVFPNSFEAVRRINQSGALAIVVTNQSVVARGLLSERKLAHIHQQMEGLFAQHEAHFDGIYHCPHHPTEGRQPFAFDCDCRKPKPGMLVRAASELELDLNRCVIIGDTLNDIAAGHRAGSMGVLVETGYGAEISSSLRTGSEPVEAEWYPDYTASDILQAVNWSLEKIGERSSL